MAAAAAAGAAPARRFTFAPDGFYQTLRREVREHFVSKKRSHKVKPHSFRLRRARLLP